MRKIILIMALLGLGMAHSEEPSKPPITDEIMKLAENINRNSSLHVGDLRDCGDGHLGGQGVLGSQTAKNAEYAACVMYVLAAVDMLREWQKIDPVHALPVCVPRTIRPVGLLIEVQEHIKANAPWLRGQIDAATAVIDALAAKWPCPRRQP